MPLPPGSGTFFHVLHPAGFHVLHPAGCDTALLQKNVLDRQRWQTRDQLRLAIIFWIERTYHSRRRQDRLGRLTPVEFEALLHTAHAA